MRIKIKRVDKSLPLPEYKTEGAVAFDFYARLETKVLPKNIARIPSNLIIETPPGYMLLVASRGSTPFKQGLMPSNGIGVGDQDFWGEEDEYDIAVYNFTEKEVIVKKGERIAQGIFIPIEKAEWDEVEVIEEKSRGKFGSTGK